MFDIIKSLVIELKIYGIKEVYYHLTFRKHANELVCLRAEKIKGMTLEEKKKIVELEYKRITGKKINFDNPETFNEKIQWLKIYDNTPLKTRLADKFAVREWIKEQIGEKYLVPLIGVWDDVDDINFKKLPDKYCIKLNHGSGMNIVVKNNQLLDYEKAKSKLKKWIKTPFGVQNCYEFQYLDIKPRIIAEEYIEQNDGNLLDYKIHCFDGEPKEIQVIGNRLDKEGGLEAEFDCCWERNYKLYKTYNQYKKTPQKPKQLDKMLEIARILSKDFKYVRVDLYVINEKIFFGEMTFTPASGLGKWEREEDNLLLGSWIDINKGENGKR